MHAQSHSKEARVEREEYEVMYRVEDSLWWYRGMEAISRAVLERTYARDSHLRILDAGCGTGAVLSYLADYGAATGMDFSPHALRFSLQRGHRRLSRGSVNTLPFADDSFDLLTSFDVLCVNGVDDGQALREFRRVLAPGGRVFLRLPAYNWLRGAHDRAVNIRHRYTAADLRQRIAAAGLLVEHLSYANMWLLPLAVAKRWAERLFPRQEGSDLTLDIGPLNGLFRAVLSSEAKWVARRGLPLGLTVVAVARRPA